MDTALMKYLLIWLFKIRKKYIMSNWVLWQ